MLQTIYEFIGDILHVFAALPAPRESGIYHYPWQSRWEKGFYPGGFEGLILQPMSIQA